MENDRERLYFKAKIVLSKFQDGKKIDHRKYKK